MASSPSPPRKQSEEKKSKEKQSKENQQGPLIWGPDSNRPRALYTSRVVQISYAHHIEPSIYGGSIVPAPFLTLSSCWSYTKHSALRFITTKYTHIYICIYILPLFGTIRSVRPRCLVSQLVEMSRNNYGGSSILTYNIIFFSKKNFFFFPICSSSCCFVSRQSCRFLAPCDFSPSRKERCWFLHRIVVLQHALCVAKITPSRRDRKKKIVFVPYGKKKYIRLSSLTRSSETLSGGKTILGRDENFPSPVVSYIFHLYTDGTTANKTPCKNTFCNPRNDKNDITFRIF